MSNLIDRDEVLKVLKEETKELSRIGMSYQVVGVNHFKQTMNEIEETILSLPLQQQGVFELGYCNKCIQMTNHLNGICQKCKQQQGGNEKIKELIEKKIEAEQKSYDKVYLQCYQGLLSEIENLPNNN